MYTDDRIKSMARHGAERHEIEKEPLNLPTASFSETDVGEVFSWEKVSTIHRTRNGIYQRNGRLISLLTDFGRINPCYPDTHGETRDSILYTGNGRSGDQKLDAQNQALLDAVASKMSVPLFNKLAPGRWEFLGYWAVTDSKYIYDETQKRMVWKFTLEKTNNQ